MTERASASFAGSSTISKPNGDIDLSEWRRAFRDGGVYGTTAGAGHSAQHGLLGVLRAVNSGVYDFVGAVGEYGERARAIKALFLANGFHRVYDRDLEAPLADGFYFTITDPGCEDSRRRCPDPG
ncbi:MAG: hypothetical protein ACOWWM_20295 [Desulfobacterales bacterium]